VLGHASLLLNCRRWQYGGGTFEQDEQTVVALTVDD